MPYRLIKKNPVEVSNRQAIGVRFPFTDGFVPTYQTIDAVKSNLKTYLLTARGDRYFNPLYGNSLLNILFEHYTKEKADTIERLVRADLAMYFPKLILEGFKLIPVPDQNYIQMVLQFGVKDTGLKDELVIDFSQ